MHFPNDWSGSSLKILNELCYLIAKDLRKVGFLMFLLHNSSGLQTAHWPRIKPSYSTNSIRCTFLFPIALLLHPTDEPTNTYNTYSEKHHTDFAHQTYWWNEKFCCSHKQTTEAYFKLIWESNFIRLFSNKNEFDIYCLLQSQTYYK